MAITSGFYNALNHDRQYEATQIGSIFDGIIEDGIYETIGQKFMVTASGNGLVVNVGTGRAWFDHTWTLNDAILPIEMDEAELVLDRIDAVVLEVDASLSGRTNAVKTVKGTPSSQPVKPTLINTEEVHQYPLAYVSIKAEQTLIEQSDIENAVGTSATPFVVGVLEMMDVDALVAQWQTQFENMMRDDQQDFTNWEIMVKAAYEAWFAGVQAQMEEDIDEFETWESTTKTTFDTWFQNLQDELDENQAAHLQRQIGTLSFLTTTNKSDLVSAINEVNSKASASISEILIDYDPSTMLGATVTLTHTASAEGHTGESYTIVLENPNGEQEVDVANLGHWTITEDRFGTQVELEIHYFGYYHVNIGGDIFINVSYADDFAGKVIYCTNGTKTYHKTAGAIGETVQFCVNDEGVWTIYSSVGVTRYEVDTPSTVHDNTYNVLLQTTVTLTIPLYSAAADTVSYTDAEGAKTVVTDSSGEATAAIVILATGQNVTFTSSVAKEPDDLTVDYSKAVALTDASLEVKVMPDNVLYWYGYNNTTFTDIHARYNTSWSFSTITPTFNTNNVAINGNATNGDGTCKIGDQIISSQGIKEVKTIIASASASNDFASVEGVRLQTQTSISDGYTVTNQITIIGHGERLSTITLFTLTSATNINDYISFRITGLTNVVVNAIWLE